jgi:conjugal transfer pilus assembly protein TraK
MDRLTIALLMATLAVPAWALNKHDGTSPIRPESPIEVELSASDVNRITCGEPISDLIYSQEKGLEGQFNGNNAFLKFKLIRQGKDELYATKPTELYVVCGEDVYTLIVLPKRIPAVTLKLSSPKKAKAGLTFAGMPYERKVVQLVQEGYRGVYPEYYKVTEENQEVTISPDVRVILKRTVEVDEEHLRLKVFYITGNPEKGKTLELTEKDFLLPCIGQQVAALAIEDHTLPHGSMTRMFVVEHVETGSEP